MFAESRGPGRPAVEGEEKKVAFSASIRALAVRRVETMTKITGEAKGPLIERLVMREYEDINRKVDEGERYFEGWLTKQGFKDPPIAYIFDDDLTIRAFRCGDLTIYATERALYYLAIVKNQSEALSDAGEALRYLERYHTKFARFDVVNGALNLGTPESVQHSLEAYVNRRVRMWIVGESEPYYGTLTDFGEGVALMVIAGGPSTHNGTGLIPKANVLRVEELEV